MNLALVHPQLRGLVREWPLFPQGFAPAGAAELAAFRKAYERYIPAPDASPAYTVERITPGGDLPAFNLWVVNAQHHAALGVDPARIAILGESAGGGHAALLALAARDRAVVKPCFVCLVYPMLDDRCGSPQVPPAVLEYSWAGALNRYGWRAFLGCEPGQASAPPAVPARWPCLAGLPPTWLGVGSVDLFADEGIAYAQRLRQAGVAIELQVVPGAFHGFDDIARLLKRDIELVKVFEQQIAEALRRGWAPSPA